MEMNIKSIRDCKQWCTLRDDQVVSLVDAFLERVKADDDLVKEITFTLSLDYEDSYKIFLIQDIIDNRKPISEQRGMFVWVD